MSFAIYRCSDCGTHSESDELHAITEEDIIEHFEQAGFTSAPSHAFDSVGQYVCPQCSSRSIEIVDVLDSF